MFVFTVDAVLSVLRHANLECTSFFYTETNMINRAAVLKAEKILFNSVLSSNLVRNPEHDIQEIIKVYIEDAEVINIMQNFNLTANDFAIIYYHIFDSLEFRELLFVEDSPCLFATGLITDLQSMIIIGNRTFNKNQTTFDNHQCLLESADFAASRFFQEHAVKQNIVSVQHFCRNGINAKLRK